MLLKLLVIYVQLVNSPLALLNVKFAHLVNSLPLMELHLALLALVVMKLIPIKLLVLLVLLVNILLMMANVNPAQSLLIHQTLLLALAVFADLVLKLTPHKLDVILALLEATLLITLLVNFVLMELSLLPMEPPLAQPADVVVKHSIILLVSSVLKDTSLKPMEAVNDAHSILTQKLLELALALLAKLDLK